MANNECHVASPPSPRKGRRTYCIESRTWVSSIEAVVVLASGSMFVVKQGPRRLNDPIHPVVGLTCHGHGHDCPNKRAPTVLTHCFNSQARPEVYVCIIGKPKLREKFEESGLLEQ